MKALFIGDQLVHTAKHGDRWLFRFCDTKGVAGMEAELRETELAPVDIADLILEGEDSDLRRSMATVVLQTIGHLQDYPVGSAIRITAKGYMKAAVFDPEWVLARKRHQLEQDRAAGLVPMLVRRGRYGWFSAALEMDVTPPVDVVELLRKVREWPGLGDADGVRLV